MVLEGGARAYLDHIVKEKGYYLTLEEEGINKWRYIKSAYFYYVVLCSLWLFLIHHLVREG
jgi:hypothetical protein